MSSDPKLEQDRAASELGLENFRPTSQDAGLSLDQLTAAFAEMLSQGSAPYGESPPAEAETGSAARAEQETDQSSPAAQDEPLLVTPRTIFEAMLFVGAADGSTLTSQRVASLMRGVRAAEIDQFAVELNVQYRARGCPYWIEGVDNGYRMTLREEWGSLREKFAVKTRQARLSQAAIEVLAIVAYNEPLTSEGVNDLRGTTSTAILTQLVRRQLLRVERIAGSRRAQYRTTARFLDLFGLESLADLPRSLDLEEQES